MSSHGTCGVSERSMLWDRFHAVLVEATKHRNGRRKLVVTAWGLEIEWALYERAQMQAAVNAARNERGYPPVGIEEIRRVDQYATGHVDWLDKFALYCAELALSDCSDREGRPA